MVCEAFLGSNPKTTMVVYRGADGQHWVRTRDDFQAMVEVDGKTVPRFAEIKERPPVPGSAEDVMAKTLALARLQLGNYKTIDGKPKI